MTKNKHSGGSLSDFLSEPKEAATPNSANAQFWQPGGINVARMGLKPEDLLNLQALLTILRDSNVRSFNHGDIHLSFFAPEPEGGVERKESEPQESAEVGVERGTLNPANGNPGRILPSESELDDILFFHERDGFPEF